jgi:phosphatidylglycerophosphate synthase
MDRGIYRLKPYKDQKLATLANWLHSRQISANIITFSGLICGLLAALCLFKSQTYWGLTFILSSIFADMLDGTVARLSKTETLNCKLFDSVCDRVVETAWVGALIYTGLIPWWGWLLPLVSVMLLCSRYWAYRHDLETSFIMVARFERMAAIISLIIIPWRWLTLSFFLLVVIGTFIANLAIINAIFNQRNSKSSVQPGICKD